MGSGSRDDVPEWASFFSTTEYRAFHAAVGADLKRRGWVHQWGDGVVQIRQADGSWSPAGLLNLAQVCNQVGQDEWPQVVSGHFDRIGDIDRQQKVIDALKKDFEQAHPHLRVRLYPEDYAASVPDARIVARRPAPGLLAVLALDLPEVVTTVDPDCLAGWRRGEAELFRLGLDNVAAKEVPIPQTMDLPHGSSLTALIGDSFFTASHALLLDRHLDSPCARGALVGVPHRHAVIFHAIRGLSALTAIQHMIPVIRGMNSEGPGSISPDLYWVRGERWTLLPAELKGRSLTFRPPDEFTEMLNGLADGEE